MRALFMDFKADKNTWNNNREYMFGRNILVCPVIDPLYTPEKKVETDAMTGWDNNVKLEKKNGYMVPDWTAERQFDLTKTLHQIIFFHLLKKQLSSLIH